MSWKYTAGILWFEWNSEKVMEWMDNKIITKKVFDVQRVNVTWHRNFCSSLLFLIATKSRIKRSVQVINFYLTLFSFFTLFQTVSVHPVQWRFNIINNGVNFQGSLKDFLRTHISVWVLRSFAVSLIENKTILYLRDVCREC